MDLLGRLFIPILLASLIQIQNVLAECHITSVTSPSASALNVKWTSFTDATNYFLDLRIVNDTSVAPVVVTLPASSTQRLVQGLRPGRFYDITLKVFKFYYVVCTNSKQSYTVPATSQLTYSKAISSTTISLQWSSVTGAKNYQLVVNGTFIDDYHNITITSQSAQITGLQPATAYNCLVYSSNEAGSGARSIVKTVTTLVQPPDGVVVTATGRTTARVTWNLVQGVLLYQVKITDNNDSATPPVIKKSSTTSLDITNLEPCSSYTIGVSSINAFLEPGEPSDFIHTTSTINSVTSASVDYSCSSGMVTVTWNGVFGADSYRATAMDGNGTALTCTSESTSCQITMLRCGERYLVTVTAISDDCESTSNYSAPFQTVPCPPVGLSTYHECASNVIVFSWEATNSTNYYVATSLDANGQVVECRTTETSCYFTGTSCGQRYKYTVHSVSGACNSGLSNPIYQSTAPCLPQNVKTSADCDSDVLISTWDSAAGALSYTVEALGNRGDKYNCSSFTNSCAIPFVNCGEVLSIWITASHDECTTDRVLGEVAETVPCIPQNFTLVESCNADSVSLDWETSNGAIFYIGMAVHSDGSSQSCMAMDTQCDIQGLRCGTTYDTYVVATNIKCNSSQTQHATATTAPCPPSSAEAMRDCAANHALVVWQKHLATGTYTAVMEDGEGTQLNCSTADNHCTIRELACGQNYSITLQHSDRGCTSSPSTPTYMESVPCAPQQLLGDVNCDTGALTVSWNITSALSLQTYTTTASTGTGQRIPCNSTATQCTVGGVECGRSYMVSVQSVQGACHSLPSQELTIEQVPCVPTDVNATRTCGESSIDVKWAASAGAKYYTALATTSGHSSNCMSNSTSCSIPSLLCGRSYNVSVAAANENCTSHQSQAVILQTASCPPASIQGSVNCSSGSASLTWDAMPTALLYMGTAVSGGGHVLNCSSSESGCQLSGLQCGTYYNFSVSATDGRCASPNSAPYMLDSGPCAPVSEATSLSCATNTLTVSWNSSAGAVAMNYTATAGAEGRTALHCSSPGSSCSIPNLQCGVRYNVTVTVSHGDCTSSSSALLSVQTAPCIPQNVTWSQSGGSNTLMASWDATPDASDYWATVTGPGGFSEVCSTASLSCTFRGLQCASQYALSVASSNRACNSSYSSAVSLTTAACDVQNVTAVPVCGSNAGLVSWVAGPGANAYTVRALGEGHQTSCHTNGTSCEVGQLMCGQVYNITVLLDGGTGYNDTSEPSATLHTAPCSPNITTTSLDCGSSSAAIYWSGVANAVEYLVNATSTNGHMASCRSANASCSLSELRCGQTYGVFVSALGEQCNSNPSATTNVITAPCPPSAVSTLYDCDTNTITIGWDDSDGSVSFVAMLKGAGHMESCQTSGTSCSVTGVQCGQNYTVAVKAVASHCNSSYSPPSEIHTVPCAPQSVNASLVCANNSAMVSWDASAGAMSYNVSAVGGDGDARGCHTYGTRCDFSGMHCGQTYDITVTPYAVNCSGVQSTAITFNTGPCPPANVSTSLECEGNIASVMWSPVASAELYIITATGPDGNTSTCSSNSTHCSFTYLQCAQTYSVSVVTVVNGCPSDPSPSVELRTALCPPMNLAGTTSCETNVLSLTWNSSPVSGATYFLFAQEEGGASTIYSASGTSLSIPGLSCGQHYNFSVSASHGHCNSCLSTPLDMYTAPCQPTHLAAQVDCGSSKAHLTWQHSGSAMFFTAEVSGEHGHMASCSSNGSSCAVRLHCGRSYNATVVAVTDSCNSTQSTPIQFDSAPCLPQNVTADLDCSANQLAVQWLEMPGSDLYTALAIGTDGYRASCNTTSTACTIHNLQCGQTYSIAVTTSAVNCSISHETDYQIESAPCKPQGSSVELECSSNMATVRWQNSSTAQTYNVTALDGQGGSWSCSSNQTSCSFSQLSCGTNYSFSVVGLTEECVSEASDSMQLLTAPCVPMSVTPLLDCNSSAVSVSWSLAPGASHYVAMVECSKSGFRSSCNSTDTQCSFSDLGCGEEYTVTVQALHGECVSAVGAPVTFNTGPCPHSNLEASLDCLTSSALVSWTPGNGSVSYNATAESPQTSHPLVCSSSGSSCNISGLQCGQRYTVSVSGEGHTCPATSGESTYVDSAPCAPTNVTVTSACESDSASVSWTAANGALSYLAAAEMADGQRLVCSTNSTSCDISGLQCGQEYEVTVTAMDNSCNGTKSTSQTLRTAPCTPQVVTSHLDCQAGGLNVSWQVSVGAVGYCARVEGTGEPMMCESGDGTSTTCYIPHLPCGHSYNLTVVALGDTCNSSRSAAQEVMAAPCPPSSVSASLDCNAQVALVSWDLQGALGITYAVNVSGSEGVVFTCSTSNSNCSLSGLMCGQEYNVTVTASAHGCTSAPSATHTLTQASCSHSATLMRVEMLCQSDSALVWWDGAGEYMATAEDGGGHRLNCTSSNTSCEVSGLRCGQLYTFSVTPTESPCESQPNSTLQKYSAPCPPQNVQSSLHCDNDTASISWTPSSGAMFYIATLEQVDRHQSICNTSGSSCDFSSLLCGQIYMVTVAAEGQSCNSSQIPGPPIMTAPCVPGNLMVNVSCSSNIATVTWDSSYGAVAYTVDAIGNGHSATCNSTMPTCDLSTLNCGQNYTITVSAEHVNCSSGSSPPVEIHTVPCVPSDIMASVHCMSNSMTVNWTQSAGGDTYTATLEDSNGLSTTCQSLGSQCNVSGLHCGQIYHVSVTASDAQCSSASSTDVSVHSVPCTPTGIQAIVDCNLGTATLSWQNSPGAVSYTAVAATSSLWQNMTCDTNATNCEMDKLACGEEYAVTVMAHGDTCYSSAQMPEYLITEPCVPLNLRVDYSLSTAQLYWDFTKGATNFTAEAVTPQGLNASCSTNTTNCALSGMVCGQVYNITITAHNQVCQETSEAYQLMTEPCPPQNVQSSMDCQTSTGTVSWEQSLVAVEYSVLLERQNGHSASCVTSDTCSMDGLACGTVYSVGVKAIGSEHNSSMSSGPSLITAPCLPGNVTVEVDCEQDSAMVHWNGSAGVKNYTVTALSSEGQQAPCFTQQNQCNITGLQCGQTYNISITATNQACALTSDTGVIFQTRPCAPTSVSVEQQCGSRSATLSWRGQDGVEDYTGTATQGSNGHVVMCNSNSSSCVFPSLACGERYTFTVSAHGQLCPSNASSAVEIQTEPCQPGHVTTHVACNNDTVEFDWADSKGAMSYIISVSGCLGYMVDFNSTESQMEAILPCGQTYNVTVTPKDDRCDGPQSAPKQFKTGLCVPAHVETYVQCEAHTGSVSWFPSDGAQLYSAMATGSNGETHPCVTNDTSCTWNDLQCGEHYSVRVMASDGNCTSPPSNSSTIHMAPCITQSLMPMFDCGSKMATLYWRASAGAQIYTVRAEAAYGPMVALSTNSTSAQFSELTCGQNYSLTLTAHNMECSSAQSTPASLMTEPCAPTEVSSSIDCVSNIAVVSWEDGNGTDYYTATLQDSNGQSQSCMSSSGQCGISTLTCGQNYSVSVTASNMQCNITTTGSSLDTAPCVPMGVSVEVDCSLNSALVSWNRSVGALSYQVTAQSSHGNSSCYSSSLSCTLANITCGANYSVQVVAMDDSCSSTPSQPVLFQTAPCAPVNVSSSDDCSTGVVLVTWDHSYGAVSYTASAQGSGGYTSSCNTTGTSCQFSDLLCGMTYDITLSAQSGQTCSSQLSSPISINTVPCEPQNASAQLDCSTRGALVSWEASDGSNAYLVQAVGANGHHINCSSSSSNCSLPSMHCSQSYNITVTVLDGVCDSVYTQFSLQSASCPPGNVQTSLQCDQGVATVSWQHSSGAMLYMVVGEAASGHRTTCNSSATSCDLEELQCGQTYNVSVYSMDNACSSMESSVTHVHTAPCPPLNVGYLLDCNSSGMEVTWDAYMDADSYMMEATPANGSTFTCNSTGTQCTISALSCGKDFSVRVISVRGECHSPPSLPINVTSAPCAPANASGHLDCVTNAAWVSWQEAPGAHGYTVLAVGEDGHNSSCTATNSNTTCSVPDLGCGNRYTFHVIATHHHCMSPPSPAIEMETAPCSLSSILASHECHADYIEVVWESSDSAHVYVATAEASDYTLLSCNSSSSCCNLTQVRCGMQYTIVVAASSDTCTSLRSPPYRISTAPCAPVAMTTKRLCESDALLVSWSPSPGAEFYELTASAGDGDVRSCNTSDSNCTLSDLHCSQAYTLTLSASHENCSSLPSAPVTSNTVPCPPESLLLAVECGNSSAVLSWGASAGAVGYTGCAQAENASMLHCHSSEASCVMEGLECGVIYNFTVQASDGQCNSSFSEPLADGLVPCAPEGLQVRLRAMKDDRQVLVASWSSVDCPDAQYLLEISGSMLGDPHMLFELYSYWTDATFFETPIPCSSTFNVTVKARSSAGTSPTSATVAGATAPCPPLAVTYTGSNVSAVVSWNSSVFAADYSVYDVSGSARAEICNTADFSCNVTGVNSDDIAVTASNSVGESTQTSVTHEILQRRRRDLGVLPAPELTVTRVMADSIRVEWTPVPGASYYKLRVREQLTARPLRPEVTSIYSEASDVIDLKPATSYCFSVLAVMDSLISSLYSEPACATTDANI